MAAEAINEVYANLTGMFENFEQPVLTSRKKIKVEASANSNEEDTYNCGQEFLENSYIPHNFIHP